MGNKTRDPSSGSQSADDARSLGAMLASVDAFVVKVDQVKAASLMTKAPAAEAALVIAAELLRSLALITHQYAGRAALLEAKINQLEGVCYGE